MIIYWAVLCFYQDKAVFIAVKRKLLLRRGKRNFLIIKEKRVINCFYDATKIEGIKKVA
ncbi:MAG: hypothetical protein ACI87J_000788 [Colwellia sp.]|mgnify:CR=1|jgi:hypothetical protein